MTSFAHDCAFHLAHEAEWHCLKCDTKRCKKCVPFAKSHLWGPRGAVCHACNSALSHLGKARSDIPPFWTQLGHFLRYPWSGPALGLVVILTVFAILGELTGILAIPFFLIYYTLFLRYNYAIIEHRANGEIEAPDLSSVFERDEDSLTLKTFGIGLIMVIVSYFAFATGLWIGIGVVAFFFVSYPAVMIVLALQKDMFAAVNPLVLATFIAKIGLRYLLVLFCYLTIVGGYAALAGPLSAIMSEIPAAIVLSMASTYLLFVGAAMLGYVVYEYQSELGPETWNNEDDSVEEDEFDQARAKAEAYMFLRNRELDHAKDRLRPLLDRFPQDTELYDYYFRVLSCSDDEKSQAAITDYLCEGFLKEDRLSRGVTYFDQTRKLYPKYFPGKAELALELANYLQQVGRMTDAAELLRGFHKRFPGNVLTGKAYLLLAKIYYERLNKTKEALALLKFVRIKFAEREESSRAESYEQLIAEQLSA